MSGAAQLEQIYMSRNGHRLWCRLSSLHVQPGRAAPQRHTCGRSALATWGCLLAVLGAVNGCAGAPPPTTPTVASWQQNLQQYVWDRGNGDPGVVAAMSWDDVHNGFAVIGDPMPDRSTDEIGLLVAHRTIEGKPYFLFLLGTVRQERLQDLRLVALNVDGDAFRWFIGAPNDTALSLYRVWSEADRSREGANAPPEAPFPRVKETYNVSVQDGAFVLDHRESGARWTVRPDLGTQQNVAEKAGQAAEMEREGARPPGDGVALELHAPPAASKIAR